MLVKFKNEQCTKLKHTISQFVDYFITVSLFLLRITHKPSMSAAHLREH